MGWIRRYTIAKFGVDDAAFSEPIPSPKQNLWRQLFTYLALSVRWPGAARAALALGIPGLIALLLGFENEMLLIATGAYAVISGEGHPFRYRWKPMAIIGVLLVAGVTMGSFIGQEVQELVSETGNTWWISITVIFSSIVAAILVFGANSLRMTAPGIFFIVMVTSSSQMSSGLGLMPWQVGMWATVGAVSAWILGMLPALIDPHAPERQAVENLEKAVEKYEKSPSYAVQERHDASSALNTAWVALDDAGIISGGRVIRKSQSDLVARALTAQNRLAALNEDVTGGTEYENLSPTGPNRVAIPHRSLTAPYTNYRSIHRYSHSTLTAQKVFWASILSGMISIAFGLGRPDWAIVSAVLVLQWGLEKVPGSVRALHRLLGSIISLGIFVLVHITQPAAWPLLLILVICQFYAEIFVV